MNPVIVEAWERLKEERARDQEEWERLPLDECLRRRRRRERVGMRRYSVKEAADIFGWSEKRVLQERFDGIEIDGVRTIYLPDPIPEDQRVEYERTWDALLDVMARHDPIGIVGAGAPKEQYCTELTEIIPRLDEVQGAEDVADILRQEMEPWSSEGIRPRDEYSALSEDMWKVWETRSCRW